MSKSLIALTVLLLVFVPQVIGWGYRYTNEKPYSPKKYTINLDLPPKQRWAELITDYKLPLQAFSNHLFRTLGINTSYLKWAPLTLALSRDSEFIAEISAIAELSNIGFNELYLINYEYELSAIKACTSIVMRTEDGRIIHGRNLDFDFQRYLADLAVEVVFYKNGNPLYTANVLAGYIGILGGMRHGKFGITVNQRYIASVWDNLSRYLYHFSMPSAYLARKALEDANNFKEAVAMISETQIIAPTYFILSGTESHEGVIIQRDANGINATTWLQESDNDWFIVQTNYERQTGDPYYDDRRGSAEKRLITAGQAGASEKVLFDKVLSQYPNLNSGTIFTAIFSPENESYNTTMWY